MNCSNVELYHHGILGQKWGVRNGPPYPLGAGDHSASEKKARWQKSIRGERVKQTDQSVRSGSVANNKQKSPLEKMREKYSNIGDSGDTMSTVTSNAKIISSKIGCSLKTKPTSIGQDIKSCNPEWYDHIGDVRWENNCTHSVIAFAARRRGLDVEATPMTQKEGEQGGRSKDYVMNRYFKNTKNMTEGIVKIESTPGTIINDITGLGVITRTSSRYERIASQKMSAELKTAPDGAYGCAHLFTRLGGHVFVWYKEDGKIKFADAQAAVNAKKDFDSMARYGYPRWVMYERYDNLEFNENTIGECIRPARSLKHSALDVETQMINEETYHDQLTTGRTYVEMLLIVFGNKVL